MFGFSYFGPAGLGGKLAVFEGEAFCNFKKVLGQVQELQQLFGLLFYELVVEEFLQDLLDGSFSVFDRFGLVVAEPGLFEGLFFGDAEGVFVLVLHEFDDVGDFAEPEMEKFFEGEELDFDDVLGVFGEGGGSDFLSAKDLDVDELLGLGGFLYFFEHSVKFLHFFQVDLVVASTHSHVAVFGVDLYDVLVHFAVFFPPHVKLLIHLNVVKLLPRALLHDQYQMSKREQYHVQELLLVYQQHPELIQVLTGLQLLAPRPLPFACP